MEPYETTLTREYERIKEIVCSPEWYTTLAELQRKHTLFSEATYLAYPCQKDTDITSRLMVALFQKLLLEGRVRLGEPGSVDYDSGREPIDCIIIHHSHRSQGISKPELNALHLLRLYAPVYQRMAQDLGHGEKPAISSGHLDDDGKQVFYGYHWKVNQDGGTERLLNDEDIGWHAGNRDVNKRSIAICIDDDLTDKCPAPVVLEGVTRIVKRHYPHIDVTDATVRAHCDVNTATTCPGYKFNTEWKAILLARIKSA